MKYTANIKNAVRNNQRKRDLFSDMLDFAKVTLKDKDKLRRLLINELDRGCEYTFGNIIIWNDAYKTKVAYHDGSAVIRHNRHGISYLFPVGDYDLKTIIEMMMDDAEREGEAFRIVSAVKPDFERLEVVFPGMFGYNEERDYSEYVYLSEDLRELSGKKYHQKRNHIARFSENHPGYEFREIDENNIARVIEMNERWNNLYGNRGGESLNEEHDAVASALKHFFDLELGGGFIENNSEIFGFSIGEPIDKNTYCVHIEKAFHEIQGSYAVINRDFARHFCKDFMHINREDDVGQEGLRKAKLSYHPEYFIEKYNVTFK